MYLEQIHEANDIKKLNERELAGLAEEIRTFLVEKISKTGGHLASNLGVVELTMAMHLSFQLPEDKMIWDVGHQSYTHKILTGRKEGFDGLRKYGGMSGFPKRKESDCDAFDTGHSSTSISAGLGYARGRDILGQDYSVISVIGDGSLTGGMAYEALNNAAEMKTNFIIVLNDNHMSISKNVGGMSSSLPEDVQYAMYRSVPGLEHAKIVRNAYAIEYDCIDARQLKSTLEFKEIEGLFSGGQFNGSSGYEEAASQGLIAGINAARKLQGKEGIVIDRSQGYIGVLIDDLVTKESHEPYRMMTSRAEYRLLLRQDNADMRLTKIGYEVGLIDEERYQKLLKKEEMIEKEIERVEHTNVGTTEAVQALLESYESTPLTSGTTLAELIRRPELSYEKIAPIDKHREELPYDVKEQVDINIKYDGYIKRQMRQVEQFKKLENKRIPENINYDEIQSLRLEAKQKLNQIRPSSIGQASRISGVSPADVSVLLVYLSSK